LIVVDELEKLSNAIGCDLARARRDQPPAAPKARRGFA
jgi:hypothetical protein